MIELSSQNSLTPPILPERDELLRTQRRRLQHPSSSVRADAVAKLVSVADCAVPILREALNDRHVDVRLAAVNALQQIGNSQAVDALIIALEDGDVEVRSIAATGLAALGATPSVEALCEALKHRDRLTRIAAAQALGTIGNACAVPHLLEAHRRCFLGRSARGQLILGVMVVATVALILVAFIWGTFAAKMGGMMGCIHIFFRIGAVYFDKRKEQSEVAGAISNALLEIAERTSAPEVHRIVPELRSVVSDRLQHSSETRAAAREAADRIEVLTARLQQLPITAVAAATLQEETLPRPADAAPPTSSP